MEPSENIRQYIRNKEEFRSHAYIPESGDRPTIGYGSTFYINDNPVCMGDIITQESAIELFNSVLSNLAKALDNVTLPNVSQQQFDAVLSLCYNIGFNKFIKSETGFMYNKGLNISDRFKLWDEFNGEPNQGLLNRRLEEQKIYDNNIYPS